jgi:hypothetical protein
MLNRAEQLQAVLDDEAMWLLASLVPRLDTNEPGRRRIHHESALILFMVATQIFRGHRAAARELANPDHWRRYQEALRRRFPSQPEIWATASTPIRRHNYAWFKARHITGRKAFVRQARAIARTVAITNAAAIDLCAPQVAGTLTHPSAACVVGADGKVIRPRFKGRRLDKETGEIIGRKDPDATYFRVGGGERVFGNKFLVASTRGDVPNQRIILDVARSPGERGEAAHAMDMFDELLPLMPHAEVVVYDGALRGTHLNHLMTRHGIIALARLHNSGGEQVLERHYGRAEIRRPNGTTYEVDLHLRDGAPCIKDLDEEGNVHLIPLDRLKLTRTQRTDGTWRWYMELGVPESYGGGTIRLRCDQMAEDEATGFNRPEHLRLIPDSDPDWQPIMGRRSDSESGNRVIDDSFWRERAHSVGAPAQLFDLIGHQIQRNARAVEIHRRRQADAARLAA